MGTFILVYRFFDAVFFVQVGMRNFYPVPSAATAPPQGMA